MLKEKVMTATEFKAKCLNLLERLEPGGIVLTKRGRAVARVLPMNSGANERLIGSMKGKIKIKGDIFSTGLSWDAESGHTHGRRSTERRSQQG
jgi:antitoxin (DNA-binding transcriptional repressor) of toxin-antitoxin stability system